MAKSFHQLSPRAQTGVFGLLCVLTVAGAWQVLIGPERVELESRRARLSAVEAEVAQAQAVAARLAVTTREVADLERALTETTAVLPDEKGPQDVLRHLHRLASDSAVSLASWKPGEIVERAQYSEWPIVLGFEGRYHDLGVFFDRVAAMPRLLSVSELSIRAASGPGASGTISATCVATTFVFRKDTPEPSAGPTTLAQASGGRP
ncbi:MAG TPA: type 4a pilus biogenesis protein PilO [Vicinamibacterales bacterium]|nr:type 4a pilus biogenesis protein PilO [Vicinamibacterales bacterium]